MNLGAAEHVLRVRDQLLREMREDDGWRPGGGCDDKRLARALVGAFPDRVARRRDKGSPKGVMVGGRGVKLAESSAVREGDLFLCVDVEEIGSTEALVRQASRVEREWLPKELTHTQVDVEFDAQRERVVAFQRLRYEDIVIDEAATDAPDSDDVSRVLAEQATKQLDRVLAADDDLAFFVARVRSLRQWIPELNLPEITDDDLRGLLPQLARGRRSFDDLRRAPWLAFAKSLLTAEQLIALDREAPERMEAASGSRIRLQYEPGRPPVMPVRIQEMYGQLDTPRVARGRVAVVLHLLAPNQRPQQVTDDLASFWKNTYQQVRKDLRGRYPKHAWPEEPWRGA